MAITVLPVLQARADRTVHRPYLLLALLQLADVATTGIILHYWSVRAEGNPVAAFILNQAGLAAGLGVLLAFKLAAVWLLYSCQTRVRIVTGVYGLVIFNNALALVLLVL